MSYLASIRRSCGLAITDEGLRYQELSEDEDDEPTEFHQDNMSLTVDECWLVFKILAGIIHLVIAFIFIVNSSLADGKRYNSTSDDIGYEQQASHEKGNPVLFFGCLFVASLFVGFVCCCLPSEIFTPPDDELTISAVKTAWTRRDF